MNQKEYIKFMIKEIQNPDRHKEFYVLPAHG